MNLVDYFKKIFDKHSSELIYRNFSTINESFSLNVDYNNYNDDDYNDDEYDENWVIKLEPFANCSSSTYNEPFSLVTYSNDTNSFYIKYSHCWIEGNVFLGGDKHYKNGYEESNSQLIPFNILTNSFKFTFVPFDLSEKSIWIDEYIKCKERFEYHKYYLNKSEQYNKDIEENDKDIEENDEDIEENDKDIEENNENV